MDAINQGSLMNPINAKGIQKISSVPIRNPIDQIPPLDFFGIKLVVRDGSFKDCHVKIMEGSF